MYIIYFFPVQLSFCWLWPMMLDIWQCQVVVNATAPTHTHTHTLRTVRGIQSRQREKTNKQTNKNTQIRWPKPNRSHRCRGSLKVFTRLPFERTFRGNIFCTGKFLGHKLQPHAHQSPPKNRRNFRENRGQGQLNFSCYLPTKLKQHLIEIIFNKSSDG